MGPHTADLSLVNRAYPQWRIGVGELLAIFQDLPHRWGRDAAERGAGPESHWPAAMSARACTRPV